MRSPNPSYPRAIQLKRLLFALLISLVTSGCSRSDTDVQTDLQRQLAADSATTGITVAVSQGVARLSGVTHSREQQDRALDIARSVKGVKEVESVMRLDDAALTDAVKKAIASDETVKAVPLTIEVRDGEVKLFSDRTNSDQRTRLTEIARTVYGVNHVEDNMK